MDIWAKTGIADNAREEVKTERGFLLGVVNDSPIEIPFSYAIGSSMTYNNMQSGFPTDYLRPQQTIVTHRVDLPFGKNAKIRLGVNGPIMTIKNINNVNNLKTGKLERFELELVGGGGK